MNSIELDFRETGPVLMTESTKAQYTALVPLFMEGNPGLSPQESLDRIVELERERSIRLFGAYLGDKATDQQRIVFDRPRLRLKDELNILSATERQRFMQIEAGFSEASEILSGKYGFSLQETDSLLMGILYMHEVTGFQGAIDRIAKGPVIEGFVGENIFDISNEDVKTMLFSSFGNKALIQSRLMSIKRVGGFPMMCPDITTGNRFVQDLNARWEGGYLVFPTKEMYEQAAIELENRVDSALLDHTYKVRASIDVSGGISTVKVHEFVYERPSHFDYLIDLPFGEQGKMRAYFLGIIAHEGVHALQEYNMSDETKTAYAELISDETAEFVGHQYVSSYVDRHKNLYGSKDKTILNEDMAEAVRVYLTNADYLRMHYPKRYEFIRVMFSYVQENAILSFVMNL
jgi:hypothetical protein